jgi:hypothetical protein
LKRFECSQACRLYLRRNWRRRNADPRSADAGLRARPGRRSRSRGRPPFSASGRVVPAGNQVTQFFPGAVLEIEIRSTQLGDLAQEC